MTLYRSQFFDWGDQNRSDGESLYEGMGDNVRESAKSEFGFFIVLVGVDSKSFQLDLLVLHCHQVRVLLFGIFEDFHLLLLLQSVPVSCIV